MGITLRAARVNIGLTQTQAAEKLDVTKATIASYEEYKTSPTIATALRMAQLYNQRLEDLIFLPEDCALSTTQNG